MSGNSDRCPRCKRLEEGLEMARVGIVSLGTDGRILDCNEAYSVITGRAREDLVGRHWKETILREDHRKVVDACAEAGTGTAYVEARGIRPDGTVPAISLAIKPRLNEAGDITGYLCTRQDITGYRGDQRALARAVEAAPSGILMVNREGRILQVNKAVESLFGYLREELLGQPVDILLPPEQREAHSAYRAAFHDTNAVQAMAGRDLIGYGKDGRAVPVQVHVTTLDPPGEALILVTIIDIAERLCYEEQMETARKAAEQANSAKSDFLARMSHEIRTPMNLIMGMNAILLESALTPAQRQYVDISHRNVRRLLRLINGILDLSKVEAGKLTLESAPFDFGEVLREAGETFSAAFDQKGLAFSMILDPELPLCWTGDRERLLQVLLNLVGNAIKFTERGSVTVRAGRAVSATGLPGIRVQVSDTGCGIRPETRHLIFDSFQQGDGSINRRYEGTGLGLAIAQSLVRMMGGEICVEDSGPAGTTFTFTVFPATCDDSCGPERPSTAYRHNDESKARGRRILVVDDNHENSFLVKTFLDRHEMVLDFAFDGRDAVRKRRESSYDLILMDVQMPVMDGYSATRVIRAWEKETGSLRVPIIALTAHALTGAAQEAIEAGCDGHVSKPVDRDDLIEAVTRFARTDSSAPAVPAAIRERTPLFLANRRRDIDTIRAAVTRNDLDSIRRIGHDCRGIGRGFGYPAVSSAGAKIESAASSGDLDGIEAGVAELAAAIEGRMPE